MKETDAQKLQDEYAKLVEGLQGTEEGGEEDDLLANPGEPFASLVHFASSFRLTTNLFHDSSAIGRSDSRSNTWEHPKSRTLRRVLETVHRVSQGLSTNPPFLCPSLFYQADLAFALPQTRMRVLHVVAETPVSFLQHLKDITFIEKRPLKFVSFLFSSLSKNEA